MNRKFTFRIFHSQISAGFGAIFDVERVLSARAQDISKIAPKPAEICEWKNSKSEFLIHFSKVYFLFIFFQLFIYFSELTPWFSNYGM